MYCYGPPHMAKQKQEDQHEHTYSSCVRIRDVALKTCQKRWMIGRSGERGSGISMLAARHDDDLFICFIKTLWIRKKKILINSNIITVCISEQYDTYIYFFNRKKTKKPGEDIFNKWIPWFSSFWTKAKANSNKFDLRSNHAESTGSDKVNKVKY